MKSECACGVQDVTKSSYNIDRILGRVLSSQTIGVEFASKVVKVGSGSRRKRIKLQVRLVAKWNHSKLTYAVLAMGHCWH